MAYDAERHNAVLFGGVGGQTLLGDTWTWSGSAWSHRQGLTANPSARRGAAMAYDALKRQIILFGGLAGSGQLGDTWAWDGSAWQLLHPAHSPSPREGASMAFDPAISAIVLYGGVDNSTAMPSAINDTWAWSSGDWTALHPVQSPAGGIRPRLAFLSGANLVDRYGDCRESRDINVYAFDATTWSTQPPAGSGPGALCLPSLAANPERRQLVLFGGNFGTGAPPPTDTWTYDGGSWKKMLPALSPPARSDAPMVYDVDRHVMVLFGGEGLNPGQNGPLNDTWTWDGTSWTPHQ